MQKFQVWWVEFQRNAPPTKGKKKKKNGEWRDQWNGSWTKTFNKSVQEAGTNENLSLLTGTSLVQTIGVCEISSSGGGQWNGAPTKNWKLETGAGTNESLSVITDTISVQTIGYMKFPDPKVVGTVKCTWKISWYWIQANAFTNIYCSLEYGNGISQNFTIHFSFGAIFHVCA